MIKSKKVSRRSALKLGAAAAALPLVHIRTAGAAGKLAVGFWDHWVPGGNDVMQKQVDAWADEEQGRGDRRLHHRQRQQAADDRGRRSAGEDRSRRLHVLQLGRAQLRRTRLRTDRRRDEAADRQVRRRQRHRANTSPRRRASWVAVPTSSGTQTKPPCARISWFKKNGLDLQAMYPVKPEHTARCRTPGPGTRS